MELFPARLVTETARLPGANHSFLKQICAPDGAAIRGEIQRQVEGLPEVYRDRAAELFCSLDNRRFFQAFAEVGVLAGLQASGYHLAALHAPGPRFLLEKAGTPPSVLSVLAFLQGTRPGGEDANRRLLLDALSRVAARHRFALLIRRWLPHDVDPAPVRRALELWLAQVAAGQWDGRYATYEDDHLALEFSLTGEVAAPGESPLADAIGPFYAHRMMEAIEPRVVGELDNWRLSPLGRQPFILACVTDQPWRLNPGYIQDFLYGRPVRTSTGEGAMEMEFGATAEVCVFRDPLYQNVGAVLMGDRTPGRAGWGGVSGTLRLKGLLNPWASTPIPSLAMETLREDPRQKPASSGGRVLRWSRPDGSIG